MSAVERCKAVVLERQKKLDGRFFGGAYASDQKWIERHGAQEAAEAELRKQEELFSAAHTRFEYLHSLFSVPFHLSDDDILHSRLSTYVAGSVNVVELQRSLLAKRDTIFVHDVRDGLPVSAELLLLIQILRTRATACLTHISELLVEEINSTHTKALVQARDDVVDKLNSRFANKDIVKYLGSQLTHDSRRIWPSHYGTTKARTDLLLAFSTAKDTFFKLTAASTVDS